MAKSFSDLLREDAIKATKEKLKVLKKTNPYQYGYQKKDLHDQIKRLEKLKRGERDAAARAQLTRFFFTPLNQQKTEQRLKDVWKRLFDAGAPAKDVVAAMKEIRDTPGDQEGGLKKLLERWKKNRDQKKSVVDKAEDAMRNG